MRRYVKIGGSHILTYLRIRAHLRRYILDVFLLLPSRSLSLLQEAYSASLLAVLKHFGYDVENLDGPKVHSMQSHDIEKRTSLFNVMTLQHYVHDLFDRLYLWLEATVTLPRGPLEQCQKERTMSTSVRQASDG